MTDRNLTDTATDTNQGAEGCLTYVLDTSVLLSDPRALVRFDEHQLVIPIVVLDELESKRNDPVLGWAARTALRHLEQLRVEHRGFPTEPAPVNDRGGTVVVELNHQGQEAIHPALRGDSNDHRIFTVAKNLQDEGRNVVLVTKDLPFRLRASVAGIPVDEYRNEQVGDDDWNGVHRVDAVVEPGVFDRLRAAGADGIDVADIDPALSEKPLPANTGLIVAAGSTSILARLGADGRARMIDTNRRLHGVRPTSAEQHVAADLLADPDVPIVSLAGRAGTGKTLLALAAALDAHGKKEVQRIIVFRSLHAVGQETLGFLPGTAQEKMSPFAAAIVDALETLTGNRGDANRFLDSGVVDVQPVTHIRGRTFHNTWIVIDEAQQHERATLLSMLSRVGQNSKVILTHDVAQRDNLHVGRHDGIAAVVAKLAGQPLFGHVELVKTERSNVAELATHLLDDGS
jgi:PhoH-like ATPase